MQLNHACISKLFCDFPASCGKPDYPETRLARNQISQKPDYPETRISRNQIIQKPDYPETRISRNQII